MMHVHINIELVTWLQTHLHLPFLDCMLRKLQINIDELEFTKTSTLEIICFV